MPAQTESQPKPPVVLKTRREVFAAVAAAKNQGKKVGLVPTMGALHQGHTSLVEAARRECDFVVVTIFVNPTQFAPGEDFEKYPRTLHADLAKLATVGTDVVFAPAASEVYAPGHATTVTVARVSETLEGAVRPTHFSGVATVVLKLFNMVPADIAYFGQKDYQQTLVIRQMVVDLNVPIEVRVCATVRESDGLAMSSRNAYLTPEQRVQARALSQSLHLAEELVSAGEREVAAITSQMREVIRAAGDLPVDYVVLADPDTLEPVEQIRGRTVALLAVRVGTTRLIDNAILVPRP